MYVQNYGRIMVPYVVFRRGGCFKYYCGNNYNPKTVPGVDVLGFTELPSVYTITHYFQF